VDHEGKVALDRLEWRKLKRRLRARRLGLRLRDFLQHHLEGDQRAFGIKGVEGAGMQLAEMAEHILRADLDGAGASGVKPRWRSRNDLRRLYWLAGGGEPRQRVGLDVEGVDLGRRCRPMATSAGRLGKRAAHAGCGGDLVFWAVAAEDLPDLEQ